MIVDDINHLGRRHREGESATPVRKLKVDDPKWLSGRNQEGESATPVEKVIVDDPSGCGAYTGRGSLPLLLGC